ncbi:MAG: MG2 domain-containing protein [Candidatus Eremiobacteraeota bacterium]|nr:MG2 domain-containing protein [Candidatus Eremiobacteraeota bacterium]
MRSIRLLPIAVILILSACIALYGADDEKALFDKGMSYIDEALYHKAIESFKKLLNDYPEGYYREAALQELGLCHMKLNEKDEALTYFEDLEESASSPLWKARAHWRLAELFQRYRQKAGHVAEEYEKAEALLAGIPGAKEERCALLLAMASIYTGSPKFSDVSDFYAGKPESLAKAESILQKIFALDPSSTMRCKALLELGELMGKKRDYDKAEKYFKEILTLSEDSEETGDALYRLARIEEIRKHYNDALSWYRRLLRSFPGSKPAESSIKRITAPYVYLKGLPPFLAGEKPKILLTTRNIDNVSFRAYEVDMIDLFRDVRWKNKDIAFDLPENCLRASWELAIPGKDDHIEIQKEYDVPLNERGAYIIEARAGSSVVRTLTIISSLCVLQSGRYLFAADRKTGEPLRGVELFAENSTSYHSDKREGKQCAVIIPLGHTDGRGLFYWKDESLPDDVYSLFARHGKDFTVIPMVSPPHPLIPEFNDPHRIYLYTDRPLYRPGQVVHFKGIVRKEVHGSYENLPGAPVTLYAEDQERKKIFSARDIITTRFGTFSGEFTLDKSTPPGSYTLYAQAICRRGFARFSVEEYRKPDFKVALTSPEPWYFSGDTVNIKLKAEYYSGGGVPGASIRLSASGYPYRYRFAQGEYSHEPVRHYYYGEETNQKIISLYAAEASTDGAGHASFTVSLPKDSKDMLVRVEANVTDRGRREVAKTLWLKAVRSDCYLDVNTSAHFVTPGDPLTVHIRAENPLGRPLSKSVQVKGYRIEAHSTIVNGREDKKELLKEELFSRELATGSTGLASFTFKPAVEGMIKIFAVASDMHNREVSDSTYLTVSQAAGDSTWKPGGLSIITDKSSYHPGETAKMLITADQEGSNGLLTIEADEETVEPLHFNGKLHMIELPIRKEYAPQVIVKAAIVKDDRLSSDAVSFQVVPEHTRLSLTLEPDRNVYAPREKGILKIKARDDEDKPVKAELSLAVVDKALFALTERTAIDPWRFFYDREEHTAYSWVASSYDVWHSFSSCGFSKDFFLLDFGDKVCCPPQPPPDMGSARITGESTFLNAQIRRDFPDTAFWRAHITSGAGGAAEITIPFPDSLTSWQLSAVGVTEDTKVGTAEITVVTGKKFNSRIAAPRFLTQHDRALISGIIHNGRKETLEVKARLDVQGLSLEEPAEKSLTLPPGREARLDWKVRADHPGKATVTLRALTRKESDAMEISLPVIPHGFEHTIHVGAQVEGRKDLCFQIPEKRNVETTHLDLILSPSLASVLMDSLDYLEHFPYGCAEQTLNRFLPAVETAGALKASGLSPGNLEKRLPLMVSGGLIKLYDFQHGDGGWGWWYQKQSSATMTAYVLNGLEMAKKAGFRVDEDRLAGAYDFLRREYGKGVWKNGRPFILFVLSRKPVNTPGLKKEAQALLDDRRNLSDQGIAYLLRALHRLGEKEKAATLLKYLEDRVGHEGDMAFFGSGSVSECSKVETTADVLQTFEEVRPDHPLIPGMALYLVLSRTGSHWESTKSSAAAVNALTVRLAKSLEQKEELPVSVALNGSSVFEAKVSRSTMLDFPGTMTIPSRKLKTGENTLTIQSGCKEPLFCSASLHYCSQEENIPAQGDLLRISREYLPTQHPERRTPPLSSIKSGEEFSVRLTIDAKNDFEYLVLEDPRPAGCEVSEGSVWERNQCFSNCEIRDEKTVFFFTELERGKHILEYRIRAEVPGDYHVMPASVSPMYNPEFKGTSAESRIKIAQ